MYIFTFTKVEHQHIKDGLLMKKWIMLIVVIFIATTTNGQTLKEQFEEIKENSETFKHYKVIDITTLNAFYGVTLDSVSGLKSKIITVKLENKEKANKINQLNQSINTKDGRIGELELQTSTIEVFGIDLEKSTFIFISFFTIGALIIILGIMLFKYKDNSKTASTKVRDFQKLNEDFEEYKRKALDKQMKLRRDLQTERNKIQEARNI